MAACPQAGMHKDKSSLSNDAADVGQIGLVVGLILKFMAGFT